MNINQNLCVCVFLYVCVQLALLVSQLMSHSEGHREASVLTNAAAAMRLTHPRHVGQTQSLTGHVDGRTDVLPLKSQGGVLVKGQNNVIWIARWWGTEKKEVKGGKEATSYPWA